MGLVKNARLYISQYQHLLTPIRVLQATLIFFAIGLITIAQSMLFPSPYNLTPADRQLLAAFNPKIGSNLKYDAKTKAYDYNQAAINNPNYLKTQGLSIGATNNLPAYDYYGATMPVNLHAGVKYFDPQLQLGFKLLPQFKTLPGKAFYGQTSSQYSNVISHLIYPIDGLDASAVYTPEANGIQEDLILNSAPKTGSFKLSYSLQLPATLQARMEPGGSIGIYSADPALFGNINYTTTNDQALIQKARLNSTKNNLVFIIPAPTIKQTGHSKVKATYSLNGNDLILAVSQLRDAAYPLNIDPSVVISTANSFIQNGNNESDVNLAVNQISTSPLTGGTVGSWTTNTNPLPYADQGMGVVADNNYIYILGGNNGTTNINTVEYAPISGGAIGTWTASSYNFTNARAGLCAVLYNGYIYIMGGGNGAAPYSDIQYSQLGSNGAPGPWTTNTTSFTTGRVSFGCPAYNGYLYVLGGYSGSAMLNDTQYAPINADGSVGTWTTNTATFTTARDNFASAEYNGYIYIMGGYTGSAFLSDIQYARLNANGSITSWQTNSTSLPTVNNQFAGFAYNGYLYEMGGYGTGYYATVYAAPINADGTIGNLVATTSFTTARQDLSAIGYNGYIYIMGGNAGGGPFSDIQYAQIQTAGYLNSSWTANSTSLATGRNSFPAVAYNGYIYIFGGYQGGNGGTIYGDTQYAPINSNGTLGSWTTNSTTFATPRYNEQAFAADGAMFIMGGQGGSGGATFYSDIQQATINSNGSLATWATDTVTLPNAEASFEATFYNNNLYVLGGSLAKSKGSTS